MTRTTDPKHTPREPGLLAWLLALFSLVLPWIGGALAIAGAFLLRGDLTQAMALIGLGLALIALDVAIDVWWMRSPFSASPEPQMNSRTSQLIGQTFTVAEPIERGRGKVRAGDTLWLCEGPNAPLGTRVRVTGARGSVLIVDLAPNPA